VKDEAEAEEEEEEEVACCRVSLSCAATESAAKDLSFSVMRSAARSASSSFLISSIKAPRVNSKAREFKALD
jgi:hypothetical protein